MLGIPSTSATFMVLHQEALWMNLSGHLDIDVFNKNKIIWN